MHQEAILASFRLIYSKSQAHGDLETGDPEDAQDETNITSNPYKNIFFIFLPFHM